MKALVALLAVTSACSLYNGGNTQLDAGCAVAKEPAESLIDPSTNQCETFALGGGWCGCEPCPDQGSGVDPPDWAQCDSACTGLAEQACLTTSGCHATYETTTTGTSFWTCDALTPSGGSTAACKALDAQDCSTRDDCAATFSDLGPQSTGSNSAPTFIFASCAPEVPAPACATLTEEATCTARSDCEAVYTGMNCTCDASGCTCASETFLDCETPR